MGQRGEKKPSLQPAREKEKVVSLFRQSFISSCPRAGPENVFGRQA